MPSQGHAVNAIPATETSIRRNQVGILRPPAAQRDARHAQTTVAVGIMLRDGGSVRLDRHLWKDRQTAVPYARDTPTILPGGRNCQEVIQPLDGPARALQIRHAQNAHRTMLASCWRLERGSAEVP
jgi:hypothetical protein